MESNLLDMPNPNDSPASVVMLVPVEQPFNTPKRLYTSINKSLTSIRVLSSLSITLGILSIILQLAAIRENYDLRYSSDVTGHGVVTGAFCVLTGWLGLRSTSGKTRGLIVATVVFGSLSMFTSFSSAIASGLSGTFGYCPWDRYCIWLGLQWCLMSCCILACCNSLALTVFVAKVLSKGRANYYQMFAIQPSTSYAGSLPPFAPYAGPLAQQAAGVGCTHTPPTLTPVYMGGMHSVHSQQYPAPSTSVNNMQPTGSQQHGSENLFQAPIALKEINKKLSNF